MNKKIQSGEDRDAAALKQLHEREAAPVPIHQDFGPGEVTKPLDLLTNLHTDDHTFREEMQAAIDEYERSPAFRALWKMSRRAKRDSDQVSKTTADAALQAAHAAQIGPSAEFLERVDKLEELVHRQDTVIKIAKWILGMCIAGVIGAIVTVGMKIYSEGYDKGQLVNRVDQLEKKLEKAIKQ